MDWSYDAWESGEPYDWGGAARGTSAWDSSDFHLDIGCGTVKKGRIGIDRHPAPGVNIVMDLNRLEIYRVALKPNADSSPLAEVPYEDSDPHGRLFKRGLPFGDSSIESIISHHCLEHIGEGFIPLVDEVYRVLKPDGIFRAITPLFPSRTAVEDPDHCRYFMAGTWDAFCGFPDNHWSESFSVPYTKARFELVDKDTSPPAAPEFQWGDHDAREIRVALRARK
jgi:SAM-dependent methyltransferase